MPADITQEALRDAAMADEKVQHFVADKQVFKVIIVPGKLVNLLVK